MEFFKPIVANSYLHIINATLNRILYYESDSIINHLLRLYISDPKNADELLVASDKFYLYKSIWRAILETLYEKYLPAVTYTFSWEIEVTPYTLMICELTREHFESTEVELQKKILNITDEEIESGFQNILDTSGWASLGLPNGINDRIPEELLPTSRKEQLVLLLRLMNFPPLGELAQFQHRYQSRLKDDIENLAIAFPGINASQAPSFGMPESLNKSFFHVDHETFKKYGLNGFESHPGLAEHKRDFQKIRERAAANKEQFKDEVICACCGKKQEITVPEEVLQYKFLLENQILSRRAGLYYIKDYTENYKKNLSELFYSFIPNLNKVDNPDCMILVEGESEEASLPILGFRTRFILSKSNIQVYNSKSKEKLSADFLSFKANYPNRKIICMLDADAKKERDDIQRVIKDQQNKYRLVFIEKGTFEDLFDLELSVAILNEMYQEDDPVLVSDFDPSKDFLQNIKRVLFEKKKAVFDKVLFAKTISLKMDIEKLPVIISEIFEIAKDFTRKTNFVKS
ncbi:MAG: hypothetical protein J0L56_09150 [Chitinophagales bacterium]|nr:hypothetical protein [Chitinophagales bacterium]